MIVKNIETENSIADGIETLERSFEELPGQTLNDFVNLMRSQCIDF
jgi:hypothetical protein